MNKSIIGAQKCYDPMDVLQNVDFEVAQVQYIAAFQFY